MYFGFAIHIFFFHNRNINITVLNMLISKTYIFKFPRLSKGPHSLQTHNDIPQ